MCWENNDLKATIKLDLWSWKRKVYIHLKGRCISTRLHIVITQKTKSKRRFGSDIISTSPGQIQSSHLRTRYTTYSLLALWVWNTGLIIGRDWVTSLRFLPCDQWGRG
jgi:hypothetical protein